ncbi:MAG: tRNA uridine-5-carboxymethylaminomethyl(34) synthesis enzyme MnmG [candidate division Zixibacteria bacterium]|nr:tRNA uridine-5-carboxymethylaminomethyl(34) synthesis enzyme MnmG [candidate division Zixibacteria bacterium]MBU1470159.1 tRNA uridine-5-carboxymethylaminomethyl(34) synthesis enzyme MnmG [candidate division Zixibacteria bacterium]MBU2625998.1 tRNA uridine-5-carboxymethylaminomethyl(34) synthesis enzyme MnmG [candidate division Zixibacteria bacterium]
MKTGFDIVVVGGGHAGCEAALAAARMGCTVALVTLRRDRIGQMSCNPAIGGLAKGQLVKELDALGGEMGLATDRTGIQFRRLNLSKGPAVWSSRAQADRIAYREYMQRVIDRQENIEVIEDSVVAVKTSGNRVTGAETAGGPVIQCRAVILTSGTFLNGITHTGNVRNHAGRVDEPPALYLSEQLQSIGFNAGRLKTGTPPRLDGRTINFDILQEQQGDPDCPPFSLRSENICENSAKCWITYTNQNTHRFILDNLSSSALFSGQIKGIGPRYCPSIEDKVVRFSDKPRHQLFLEPEGNGTDEIYPNGFSTSLSEETQLRAIRTVGGLEDVVITTPGYAVEYDFFFPYQIRPTTETKLVEGLYFSGQINGTSGYEEAAAQGLMSGINAVLKMRGEPAFTLNRSQAYIGVLLDDLATKSTEEPYRMFTSRAEYRLELREDNAAERLIEYGYRFGLIPEEIYARETERIALVGREAKRLESVFLPVTSLPTEFGGNGRQKLSAAAALRMPQVKVSDIEGSDDSLGGYSHRVKTDIEIRIKYKGYLDKQRREIEKFSKLENLAIPEDLSYASLTGLKVEAREKLGRLRPVSLGQASRISGISPGDITVLMVHLKRLSA